jgi:hypothetical protein
MSRNPARSNVVDTLLRTPYKNPKVEKEERLAAHAKDLATRVKVISLKQGWMQRDGSFLSEYSISTTKDPKVKVGPYSCFGVYKLS